MRATSASMARFGGLALAAAMVTAFAVGTACTGTPLHERYQGEAEATAQPSASTGLPRASATPASSAPQKACTESARAAAAAKRAAENGPEPANDADAADAPPTLIAARHVLIQWMGCTHAGPQVVRTRDQAKKAADEVLRRAKAGEDLGRLAMGYSDEEAAGARAGSLGCFERGTMAKKFEEAAFSLKVGELSGIVETPFGFHIIQRTE